MTRRLSRLAALLGIAAALAAFTPPAQAEKRVALVVGNNDYKNVPKLQKAVNDARTMGDTLKRLGFSVMVAENQTRQAFSQTLLAFTSPGHAEKRVELVVGNNDHKNVPKLQKAVNDARTMGDTLKQLGFSVMVAENQTRQASRSPI